VAHATPFGELFQRLARLDEIEMRVGLICERLESLANEDAVILLHEAHRGASLGGTDARSVFLALGWALFEPRIAPRRPELGATARRVELHHVADFVAPPLKDDGPLEDKRRVPDFGRGRPLTLGERKSLARTHDRSLIQRVVRDPHPDVVRILLDNPSLTEEDFAFARRGPIIRRCCKRCTVIDDGSCATDHGTRSCATQIRHSTPGCYSPRFCARVSSRKPRHRRSSRHHFG
jgi:hypothetical protein